MYVLITVALAGLTLIGVGLAAGGSSKGSTRRPDSPPPRNPPPPRSGHYVNSPPRLPRPSGQPPSRPRKPPPLTAVTRWDSDTSRTGMKSHPDNRFGPLLQAADAFSRFGEAVLTLPADVYDDETARAIIDERCSVAAQVARDHQDRMTIAVALLDWMGDALCRAEAGDGFVVGPRFRCGPEVYRQLCSTLPLAPAHYCAAPALVFRSRDVLVTESREMTGWSLSDGLDPIAA